MNWVIEIIVGVVLAGLALGPLIWTGDFLSFVKRYGIVVAIGLAAAANAVVIYMLADKVPERIDLTADQKYSVNPGLINIAKKLDDPVRIVYLTSSKLQEFVQIRLDMIDKLTEIKNATHGTIDFAVEEADLKDQKLMSELSAKGAVRQIGNNSGDELSFSMLVSAMRITYKDQEAVYIPQIYQSNDLEYALGERLLEMYTKSNPQSKPVIAIDLPPSGQGFQMPGHPQQGSGFEWLEEAIDSKRFDVKPIDMKENSSIPEKTSLLVMIRPKLTDERQKYEVEKYLAEGGKVMLLASPSLVHADGSWSVEQTPFGLEDYLRDCGINFGKDIIADKSHLMFNTPDRRSHEYPPFFVRIKPENIDQDTALTRMMPGLVMPTPTEIGFDKDLIKKNNLTYNVLAKTTDMNWELKATFGALELDKAAVQGPGTPAPPKAVFAMVKGQFPFPFEGKPVPEWPSDKDKDKAKDKDKDKDKDKPKVPATASVASSKKEGILVICSAPEAFYRPYLEEPTLRQLIQQGNISLLLNVTESMSYGDDLIRLRTKHYETRIISKLYGDENEWLRQIWKVILIAGVATAVLLFAIYRFILRRINQLNYERKFAGTTGPSSFSA